MNWLGLLPIFLVVNKLLLFIILFLLSSFLPVSTGVPQGSILGPLLCLLFIDDLSKHVSTCNLYADDTMIDHTGKTLCEIIPKMQHDINSLCNFFAANKLTISVSKCCSMVIGSLRM